MHFQKTDGSLLSEKTNNIYLCENAKMTKEDIVELIDSWENLPFLINEIVRNSDYYQNLMEIALNDSTQKSWRAAYLVDKINDDYPELLIPYLQKIIEQVRIEKSAGKKRHFLKLISMNELNKYQQGHIFDFCIETFKSDKEPVAVRVHAMQILQNIAITEKELIPEIILIIGDEMENHSSAGITSRGKKLIAKLQRAFDEILEVKKQRDKNNS